MNRRTLAVLAAVLAWQISPPSFGEEANGSGAKPGSRVQLAAMQVEPTQPSDAQPRATLPPVEVAPPEITEAAPSAEFEDALGPFDRPLSFPALSEQFYGEGSPTDIGGLNSITRGQQSIFDQPNFGTIVDRGLIQEKQASDMFQALQFEAGVLVQATARGQASPFIRGVTGQQVLLLVDGIRMNNAVFRSGPNQYFNTMDPGRVERLEVMRGGGSVLYGGDAIGGAINIVTRGANPDQADYTGGSFIQYFSTADSTPYSRANVEGWVGRSGLFAGASYMDVHDLDIGGGRGRQPFTNFDQYAGDVKYNFLLNNQQFVTVSLSHFELQDLPRSDRFAPFVFNRPGNTPRPTFFDPQQFDMAYVRWQGEAYNVNPFFDTFSATASYTRTKEGSTELRAPTQLDHGEFNDDMVGAQFTFARDRSDEGLGILTYGAEYYYEDIDAYKFRTNPQNPAAPSTVRIPQYPDDSIYDRAGAFASWSVAIAPKLDATVGGRYENANAQATPTIAINNVNTDVFFERTYQDWVGSLGLTYHLTDSINVVGGVYEGYRAPNIDDLVSTTTFLQNAQSNPQLANLGLEPEHSYTYEIGMKLDGERLRGQIYQWWMNIDDYITRDVDPAGNVILGNHDAQLMGTELAGEYMLERGWATYGNFAYTFGDDVTDDVPFSRIPPVQGILGLRWRDDARLGYFDVFTWLVNRQDRYNPVNLTDSRFWVNGAPATPGYGTLNIRCGKTFGACEQHRVSLILANLTDQYYRVLGSGVDGAGFNAIFGYEWRR